MIERDEIVAVVHRYVERHPDEREHLRPLLDQLDAVLPITDRSGVPGASDRSALVVDDDGRMLRIWHNVFGKWLQPGGHLEPTDTNLVGASLRELAEETGVVLDATALLGRRYPRDGRSARHRRACDPGEPAQTRGEALSLRSAVRVRAAGHAAAERDAPVGGGERLPVDSDRRDQVAADRRQAGLRAAPARDPARTGHHVSTAAGATRSRPDR